MNMISWNCRGLGNPWTVRDLLQMVKEKNLSFVFLIETLCKKKQMEWIRVKLGFAGCFVVEPIGRRGVWLYFGRKSVILEIYNFSCRHIHAIIKCGDGTGCWKFTGFYGHPVSSKRVASWELLRQLKNHPIMPWLCVGDFNEVLEHTKKEGAVERSESQI